MCMEYSLRLGREGGGNKGRDNIATYGTRRGKAPYNGGAKDETKMTQEERWLAKYNEVKDFIVRNHRNPSRHRIEEHNMLSWIKQQRKLVNKGELRPERMEPFKELLEMTERYRHINQYV